MRRRPREFRESGHPTTPDEVGGDKYDEEEYTDKLGVVDRVPDCPATLDLRPLALVRPPLLYNRHVVRRPRPV